MAGQARTSKVSFLARPSTRTTGQDQTVALTSQFVKGCAMPALTRKGAMTCRGDAGRRRTSLEGGNRGMPHCRWGKLRGYGDLRGRRWARWRQLVAELAAAIAPMRDSSDVRRNSGMKQRPGSPVWAA